MLFSSLTFLYLFLPVTLLGYYLLPGKGKNYWLLLASLLFFAWGGVSYTIILIASIGLNYFFGLRIQKHIASPKAYSWLKAGIIINLLVLVVFKYTNFIVLNLNLLLKTVSIPQVPETGIVLPIGISFYTFHSLSYLIDIYRQKTTAQRNVFDLALYISMFSQLIAGPIIRYSDMWWQLHGRTHTVAKFSSGIERFLIGLSKKVLLANTLAKVADTIFDSDAGSLSAANAWLGLVCYSLQIYCDFSGYSDMAIGLGRMFGFEFMENFNFPFLSRSIKEFWRRWHISLSTWFYDYVFNPFVTAYRHMGNKAIVLGLLLTFLLSGFWHGAGWNFLLFGLLHGLGLVYDFLTKKQRKKISEQLPAPLYNSLSMVFTYLYVCLAWIFFRADTFSQAFHYLASLFHFSASNEQTALWYKLFDREVKLVLIIAIAGALGAFKFLSEKINTSTEPATAYLKVAQGSFHVISVLAYSALLLLCTLYLLAGTYNPFIYYRF